jgi:hypothetical protein
LNQEISGARRAGRAARRKVFFCCINESENGFVGAMITEEANALPTVEHTPPTPHGAERRSTQEFSERPDGWD